MLRVVAQSRRVEPQKALTKLDFTLCAIRSPQEGETLGIPSVPSVRLADDMEGCLDPINAVLVDLESIVKSGRSNRRERDAQEFSRQLALQNDKCSHSN